MEGCEERGELYFHPAYLFAVVFQGMSGWLTFPMLFIILKKYAFNVYYHPNLVFLMMLNVVTCLLLGSITAWSATNFFINLMIKPTPCDLLLKTHFCSKIRATFLFAFCLVTTSHAGILIERIWATYAVKHYERQGKALGIILAILAVGVAATAIFIVLIPEDGEELITTCLTFSASKSIGSRIYVMFFAQLLLDGLISIVHLVLYRYNIHADKKGSTSLSEQFQRNENVKTLKQVTPLLILSNVTIGVYIFVISVFRLFKNDLPRNWYEIIAANLFIMPHMPFMFTSLILIELRLAQKRQARVHRDMMASQDVPLDDQFHIAIENWDVQFQSRLKAQALANGKAHPTSSWGSSKFMSKFKKRQSTVAVVSLPSSPA
ncbi:CRE-SRA-39 protein [Caenorhabditis remanei]|uniref:CRE-SRA-39 protein n=1 Tax=Caenorhabditis remanei TaxID=31234 RepID=E3ME49_CAERE|nr:CRE-SRA-39 protein [Caenorhabditis remanei]